jgi:hypothetical protein
MTQQQKQRIYGFTKDYTIQQVCGIFMINKTQVEAIIAEMEAPKPVEKKPKRETPKLDIDPMFAEEPGL